MNHVAEKDSYRTEGYNSWGAMYSVRWFVFYRDINNLFYGEKGTREVQSDESFMKTKTTLHED